MSKVKEGDIVWEVAPVIDSDPMRVIGTYPVPVIVEKVLNDSTVLVSNSPQKHIIGKNTFFTRDECISKQCDQICVFENDEVEDCYFDGISTTPFGMAIPDDRRIPLHSTYYVGYPYKARGIVPSSHDDEYITLKDAREKLLALYPDERKFTVVDQDLCSGILFTFGFKDNEHWYMHGVASPF